MIPYRENPKKYFFALTFGVLLLAGCSSSIVSTISENTNATVVDSAELMVSDTTTNQSQGETSSNSAAENSSQTVTDEVAEPTENLTELSSLEITRLTFDITVPIYVSNALQVRLTWGAKVITASWLADETWIAEEDFQANTENQLVIMFNDSNGAVALGSYQTNFKTGVQASEKVSITTNQFDTAEWDSDGDGFSNLNELVAGTNPQARDAPVAVSATLALVPDKTVSIGWQRLPRADYCRGFEHPDGLSGFTQVGDDLDAATVQFGHRVPLHKRTDAVYMVQACNAIGCTDSLEALEIGTLDNGLTLFKASNPGAGDGFGGVVTLSADAKKIWRSVGIWRKIASLRNKGQT